MPRKLEIPDVEFVDAPPPTPGRWDATRRKEIQEFVGVLKQNPNRWAIYPWSTTKEAARAAASRISRGLSTTFGDEFSAVSRGNVVYVRYDSVE